jgi:asparagine synthase (glutamine-hydrolysing)
MVTLLPGNLLAPQGDRMLMAGSVEGRFPYLDHRVIEAAARLPRRLKVRGLVGKWILRRAAAGKVPRAVLERGKFPYRAPAASLVSGPSAPAWAREALAPEEIRRVGLFDADKASRLVAKVSDPRIPASEFDAMAITALASGQLLARALETAAPPEAGRARVALEAR